MASTYNFTIERGNTLFISFEYTNADGSIINITNYQARISLKPVDPDGALQTFLSDTENNQYSLLINGDAGRVTFRLPSSTTQSFLFNTAIYDLDLKAPNELYPGSGPQIIKLLTGTITITGSLIVEPEPFVETDLDGEQCIVCE